MGEGRLTAPRSPPPASIIFGLGSLHHLPFRVQRIRLIREAIALGFRAFDVAPAYGNGRNEAELGEALVGSSSECQVTTKFGIPVELYGARSPAWFLIFRAARRLQGREVESYKRREYSVPAMVRSLEGSLRRLRRDYVDDFMIHEPLGILTSSELTGLCEAAVQLKEQGKIVRWGVAGQLAYLDQYINNPSIDVVQFPLADISTKFRCSPKRKIAYGVYQYFKAMPEPPFNFTAFVKERVARGDEDLILATASRSTLVSFRDFL